MNSKELKEILWEMNEVETKIKEAMLKLMERNYGDSYSLLTVALTDIQTAISDFIYFNDELLDEATEDVDNGNNL